MSYVTCHLDLIRVHSDMHVYTTVKLPMNSNVRQIIRQVSHKLSLGGGTNNVNNLVLLEMKSTGG